MTNFTAPDCWVDGKFGNALEFDGVDDYVDCGSDSSLELDEFTYSAWIKPYSTNRSYQQIIGKNSLWEKGFFISNSSLRGYVEHSTSAATAIKGSAVTANVWQHVAMTYKDNEIKLYCNGQLLSATYVSGVGDIYK